MHVFERGWLSSNCILFDDGHTSWLVDSGYSTHSAQTLELIALKHCARPLNFLINTHLHSDHCGGNAALQARYAALQTHIPPGHAEYVRLWDAVALSYTPSGQQCPRFRFDATLRPGSELRLGDLHWQVHAAPGHDPHSVILFEPLSRTLVSADALWERGFGVVFPELDGQGAFQEVADTLDLIASLNPAQVIPGHGAPFTDVTVALAYARSRLQGFVDNPAKHLQYAAKVLLKFKLLEAQSLELASLLSWALGSSYFANLLTQTEALYGGASASAVLDGLVQDLVRSGAATVRGTRVFNA